MGISLDQALGIHANTLGYRADRARLLAGNLANVDTPGYLARDYDFKTALADIESRLSGIEPNSLSESQSMEPLYRVPMQPSRDGNTVELNTEQTLFAQNAMDFQTSLTFLNLKLSGLKKAIEG